MHLSICLSVCPSISMSIHLSISLTLIHPSHIQYNHPPHIQKQCLQPSLCYDCNEILPKIVNPCTAAEVEKLHQDACGFMCPHTFGLAVFQHGVCLYFAESVIPLNLKVYILISAFRGGVFAQQCSCSTHTHTHVCSCSRSRLAISACLWF